MEEKKENTFFKDYSALMLEVSVLSKTAENPFFKSGYVPLKEVLAEAKKVCLSNNFIFVQYPIVENDINLLRTRLEHKDGESIESSIKLVSKDENDPQKLGGSLTYMRRYSLTAILGIQEEDDDGAKASGNTLTQSQNKPATPTTNKPFSKPF